MTPQERRVSPRIATDALQLLVYDDINNTLLGTAVNLSLHGLMILGNQAIEQDGILQISLRNTGKPEHAILEMAIKISWQSEASTPGSYWLGAQTLGISSPHSKILENLITQAEAHSGKSP